MHTAEALAIPLATEPDVSVVLAAWNEGQNIGPLLKRIKVALQRLGLSWELIVVDGGSQDDTVEQSEREGALCILQRRIGYGGAVREGFQRARGHYVLTMDCDLSHPPELIPELWKERNRADVIIGSRFVAGGDSEAPWLRRMLSRVLNFVFSSLLAVPIKDSSSGYRLYKREVLRPETYRRENFNILQEVLIGAYSDGFSVAEVPLCYEERATGESHVSLAKFCFSYLPTLYRLWLLRNSPNAADYDRRAFDSRHFLQRYWQRRRYALIKGFLSSSGNTLDVGCGSSKLIQDNPTFFALDRARHKLRFLRLSNKRRIQAELPRLPFADKSFDQLVCSQVLPYADKNSAVFDELARVLKPKGIAVVSVPDSGRIQWKLIGFVYHRLLPNVYGASERSHYSRAELIDLLAEHGFRTLRYQYICGAELVLKLQKVE